MRPARWFIPIVLFSVGCAAGVQGPAPTPTVSTERLNSTESSVLVATDEAKPRFDGRIGGIRIAPEQTISRERRVERPCQAVDVDADTPTDLDFTVTSRPAGYRTEGFKAKTVCKGSSFGIWTSIRYEVQSTYGSAWVGVARERVVELEVAISVPQDRVKEGAVGGRPAIFVMPIHESGLGRSAIIFVEDKTLDPYGQLLMVEAEDYSFDRLIDVAEGIR